MDSIAIAATDIFIGYREVSTFTGICDHCSQPYTEHEFLVRSNDANQTDLYCSFNDEPRD